MAKQEPSWCVRVWVSSSVVLVWLHILRFSSVKSDM